MNLKGSRTEKNLKDAFAGESQANMVRNRIVADLFVSGQTNAGGQQHAQEHGE